MEQLDLIEEVTRNDGSRYYETLEDLLWLKLIQKNLD